MKTAITTLHQAHFKESGKICFDNFPFKPQEIQQAISNTLNTRLKTSEDPLIAGRDLWRDCPVLQKFLLRKIAPLAMDLLAKQKLRLLCDQWLPSPIKAPLDTLFGFQPIFCIVSIHDAITFYHPSMPCPPNEPYFVVFGSETTCYIKKESDPANHLLKKSDYAFGDCLKGDTHPVVYFS